MPHSFGVVMREVKSMTADIEGLPPIDKEDLVHSGGVGVMRFVKDAMHMHAGDRVLQRLFQTKDPLAEVEPDAFLQYNIAAIKDTLEEVRDGVRDRQREQRRFKSSYDMRTGEYVGSVVKSIVLYWSIGSLLSPYAMLTSVVKSTVQVVKSTRCGCRSSTPLEGSSS